MLKCTLDAFLSNYCPFSPDDPLVDAAIQTLALLVTEDNKEPLLWKTFKRESSSVLPYNSILEAIEGIAGVFDNKIGELNGRKRHFFFRNYDGTKLKIPGSNLTLDACFSPNSGRSSNEHDICAETAVVVRMIGCMQDSEGDREKLFSVVRHIMSDDPRRMWMYGITIEDTKMAVWHFSRSHSVKSEFFDLTKDFRTLIRVFLSFAYATPEEMGYDPTVHRIMDKGLKYVYEIPTENGTRYFKTINLIAHQGAHCITGRQTRVWKAVETKGFEGNAADEELNGGRTVALKDVWLDGGSKTEKQKLDAIFERLKTVKEEAYQWAPLPLRSKLKTVFENEGYKDYFMEIVCDSFMLGRSKAASDKVTPAPEILRFRGEDSVNDTRTKGAQVQIHGKCAREGSAENPGMSLGLAQLTGCSYSKMRPYKIKQQYRLVYKEVGISLDRVETLETAFNALLDTYVALVLMYLAGWMHRDVSAGNIIAVTRPGGKPGGKLSDLEYAKHCDDESGSSDSKIGTAFFMPLEIHLGKAYKFAHTAPQSSTLAQIIKLDPFDDQLPVDERLLSCTKTKSRPRPQLKYRFQHDLESLWWVALYMLIYRVLHPPAKALSDKVFMSTSLPTLARQQLFEHQDAVMGELGDFLPPALQSPPLIISMNAIASILHKSYFMEEPIDAKALGNLYRDVFEELAVVVVTIRTRTQDVKLYPTRHVQSRKRARPKTSPKRRDQDEYEGEEGEGEARSDDSTQKRKKKANTSAVVRT